MLDNHMVMYSELPRKASYICKGCNEVIYDDEDCYIDKYDNHFHNLDCFIEYYEFREEDYV